MASWSKILNTKCSFLIIISILLCSCEKKEKNDKYGHIPFLHQIKETKNYQVVEIMKGSEPLWDSINKEFIITGGIYYKYNKGGIFKDSMNRYSLFDLNDSFTYRGDQYNFWLENGDRIKRYFIDITPDVPPKDADTMLYRKKHIEFYNKASIVRYNSVNLYYFYKDEWYRMSRWGNGWINKNYPEKLSPPRLISMRLNPNPPDYVKQFYVPRKKVGSISDAIGAPKDFTLGTYIIRVGLPGGDSLVYRRFGDGLGNLSTFYQRPTSEGGNDSIIFIAQDYHNNKMIDGGTYFSHGGLFMIRPKKKK